MTSAFLVFDYYMNLMGNYIKLAVIMLYQPTLINLILGIKFINQDLRKKENGIQIM